MPRSKPDYKNPFIFEFAKIGNFKSYSTDMLFDFEVIYRIQLERFKEFMHDDQVEPFKEKIEKLHAATAGLKLSNSTRMYLVTDFYLVPFVMYNIEDCIVDDLEDLSLVDKRYINDECRMNPGGTVTLFLFKGQELAFQYDLSIFTAMTMLIGFQKENMINTGAFRDEWYGAPRRRAREEQQLLQKSEPQ